MKKNKVMKISKLITSITLISLLFGVDLVMGQNDSSTTSTRAENKPAFKDRLIFGGNFGLQFGTVTYIDISPTIGYKVTEKFHAGIGGTYIYFSEKYRLTNGTNYTYKTDIYGGKVFARYFVMENLFLHHETELLNLEVYDVLNDKVERKNIISPLVGAGYVQRFGQSSGLFIMALFNLNETADSPYSNPIIRLGINFGL